MTIQTINIGALANDGTGDDLRAAFLKVNNNFNELDLRDDESTTVSNIGTGGNSVFKQRTGNDLELRKIIQGDRISVTTTGDLITIAANLSGQTIVTDGGSITTTDGSSFNILGGSGISTTATGSSITITNDAGSASFENNFDFGEISQSILSHRDYLQYITDVDYGTITTPTVTTNLGAI